MSVPDIQLVNVYLSIPFKKNSPFVDIIDQQLDRALQEGKIDKILKKYLTSSSEIEAAQCEDLKNSLGFSNAFLPFAILAAAVGASMLIMVCEKVVPRPFSAKHESAALVAQTSDIDYREVKALHDLKKIRQIMFSDDFPDELKIALMKQALTELNIANR